MQKNKLDKLEEIAKKLHHMPESLRLLNSIKKVKDILEMIKEIDKK